MKILCLADLHDDFSAEAGRDPFAGCEDLLKGVEALVLAGDLANKPQVRWKQALARLRARFGDIPVFAFPGIHDFYNWHIDRRGHDWPRSRPSGAWSTPRSGCCASAPPAFSAARSGPISSSGRGACATARLWYGS